MRIPARDHYLSLSRYMADARRFAIQASEAAILMTCRQGRGLSQIILCTSEGKSIGKSVTPGFTEKSSNTEKLKVLTDLTEKVAFYHWYRLLLCRYLLENGFIEAFKSYEGHHHSKFQAEFFRNADAVRKLSDDLFSEILLSDDPAREIELAKNDYLILVDMLLGIPGEVFLADDSAAWSYQFWQASKKTEISMNKHHKVVESDIPPVTQLFTESYMRFFLLHNTLGAWWCSKMPAKELLKEAFDECELRSKAAKTGISWDYLRFAKEDTFHFADQTETGDTWTPVCGSFAEWPTAAKDLRIIDPAMGGGHFLTSALPILTSMRMEQEGLSNAEACMAVLRENLYGLEIDRCCTGIAAFNLALTAWRLIGFRPLPVLNMACCGNLSVCADELYDTGAERPEYDYLSSELKILLKKSGILGSLINPSAIPGVTEQGQLISFAYNRNLPVDPGKETTRIRMRGDDFSFELLRGKYHLVLTNVPYLGRGKQNKPLAEHCLKYFPDSKLDLATCFVERCMDFCAKGGVTALVTPQNWLFLRNYKRLRNKLLVGSSWKLLAILGERGFCSSHAAGAFSALVVISNSPPDENDRFIGLDVSDSPTPDTKSRALVENQFEAFSQKDQLENPDSRIILAQLPRNPLLSIFCKSIVGIQTNDNPRFIRFFWEIPRIGGEWQPCLTTTDVCGYFSGRTSVIRYNHQPGFHTDPMISFRGKSVLEKTGVAISRFRHIRPFAYFGELFEQNVAVICPDDEKLVPALWAFCSSGQFKQSVRAIDRKLNVTNATLSKVPFDIDHWISIAENIETPDICRQETNDPTQWIFDGDIRKSDFPLHVAVAKMMGYCWPRETGSPFPGCPEIRKSSLSLHDDPEVGVMFVHAFGANLDAASLLEQHLAKAYGNEWSESLLRELLKKTDCPGQTLENWLRNAFFEEHCRIFKNRPFIWQIWDGCAGGFSVLLNYHMLSQDKLELVMKHLKDWIDFHWKTRRAGPGLRRIISAAEKLHNRLEEISAGNPPYDIFVRWKSLENQPIGWKPDLNDGVRINIRPFVIAGILRKSPRITWGKDRGKDPVNSPLHNLFNGERINDYHRISKESK